MTDVRLYERENGRSPFADWFAALDRQAAAKVTIAIERLRLGNFSSVKGLGAGVQEFRIDWGPGYRLYLGRDGDKLVILRTRGSSGRLRPRFFGKNINGGGKANGCDAKLQNDGRGAPRP